MNTEQQQQGNGMWVEPDRPMLISEELFLLLFDRAGNPVTARPNVKFALAAAIVADAILAGRAMVTPDKASRVLVVNSAPTAIRAIDAVMPRLIAKNGRPLGATVRDGKIDPSGAIADRLVERGLIGRTAPRRGGLVPSQFPTVDSAIEDLVRARLRGGLLGAPMVLHDATLLAIIEGLGAGKAVFPLVHAEIGPRVFDRRLKAIAAQLPIAKAVADARHYRDGDTAAVTLLTTMMVIDS